MAVSVERHIQTILAALLIGLVGWVGITVYQTGVTVARLEERVGYMAIQIQALDVKMNAAASGRYSASDAARDFVHVNERLKDHDKRIRTLEGLIPRP